jgi:hypothetical protein
MTPAENLLLNLPPSEVQIIRSALRLQQDSHKRNDFKALESAVMNLRDKITNAMLEQHTLTLA